MSEQLTNGVKKFKKTKNQLRRERAKAKRAGSNAPEEYSKDEEDQSTTTIPSSEGVAELSSASQLTPTSDQVEVANLIRVPGEGAAERASSALEPIIFDSEIDESMLNNPLFSQYKVIFNKFYTEENLPDKATISTNEVGQIFYSDDEDGILAAESSDNEDQTSSKTGTAGGLTKKKLRQLQKIPLAELKAHTRHPEVVEWFDADAADPDLLLQLKGTAGVVPVPDHWQNKREYLSSRRGIKKAPFELPDFIKDTGIMDMRDSLKEDESTLKQKTRERVQPKMGRLDIDYQKLHNAFFRFQTRPRLFGIGEVYYEGKENEKDLSGYRPGRLSQRLKEALNIPRGAPPPWLLSMQRFGPPPSYPGLRIPGLNAPIPPGAQWGFQPGGWGRAPVDEKGAPLYGGDLYGLVVQQEKSERNRGVPVEKESWGKVVDDIEEEESDEEEEEGNDEMDNEANGLDYEEGQGYVDEDAATAADQRMEANGRAEDTGPGLELRKTKRDISDLDSGNDERSRGHGQRQLFQVLEQKEPSGEGFMGRQRTYDIAGAGSSSERKRRRFEDPSEVSISLDPSMLESGKIDDDAIASHYNDEAKARQEFEENLDQLLASEKTKSSRRK